VVQTLVAKEAGEVAGVAEVLVDRGVADIGHLIDALQRLHDEVADRRGRDFGLAQALQLTDDPADQLLDLLGLHRALAEGDAERALELVPVERGATAVALEDDQFAQLDPLEGGETPAALRTGPAAADGGAVVGRAAVLHLGVRISAEGAFHRRVIRRSGSGASARALRRRPVSRRRRRPRRRPSSNR